MKAIKISIAILLASMSVIFVQAQVKSLQEGSIVPNVSIGHSLNNRETLGTFDDYKGKLVILDFWHTTCSACLRGFPEMARLQEKFGDKIKIFLVTMNTDAEVNKLFARLHPNIGNLSVVAKDTLWNKFFPHLSNPHHVWIAPDGVYKYATFDHNATEENISKFLQNGSVTLSNKQIGTFKDGNIFDQANGTFNRYVEKKSVLLRGYYEYTVGKSLAIAEDSIRHFPKCLRASGLSPLELLKCANYDRIYGYNPGVYGIRNNSRTIIEVKNHSDLYPPKDNNLIDQWNDHNFYGYEITVKPESYGALFKNMRVDIENQLPYKGAIEMRTEKYLALITTGKASVPRSDGGGRTSIGANGLMDFKDAPISDLVRHLNNGGMISSLPIIDETSIDYHIDFKILTSDFYKLDSLRAALKKVGLDIIKKQGKIPMLVIRDKEEDAAR